MLPDMDETFYDAVWERLVALKSLKFVSRRKRGLRITKRGIEFLKHEDREYYLLKILISEKLKRTKHPEIFIECYKQYARLSPIERRHVKRILKKRGVDHKVLTNKDFEIWWKFINQILKSLKNKGVNANRDLASRICDSALTALTVGLKDPIDYNIKKIKKVVKEIAEVREVTKKASERDVRSYIIDNLLETHLEEIIRRNFDKIFPDVEVIDGGNHYLTAEGNYIDILAKDKNGYYVVIELKRDRAPSKALVQLLDYINQISEEFKTNKVRGVLICRKVDRRIRSALQAVRKMLKEPGRLDIMEFDIKVELR